MASSSNDSSLPISTILHLLTNRLSSTNYILWKNQLLPILTYQNLLPHIDGSETVPPKELSVDGKTSPNPLFDSWIAADQRAVILLHASLTEEASAEIVGLSTAREIWATLEATFSSSSVERIQNLRDQLRSLARGNLSVSEYGRRFKGICDQLAAIGQPVLETDKVHWFLCGLGPSYENFSTAIRASRAVTTLRDLLLQAENHELFLGSIHGSVVPSVAFTVDSRAPSNQRGRGSRPPRGGRGRGRRPPHCQLCRQYGHYATGCSKLPTFAARSVGNQHQNGSPVDLAQAFHAQCNVSSSSPDWYVDSGATDHMTSSTASVTHPTPYTGNSNVSFGDGSSDKAGSC